MQQYFFVILAVLVSSGVARAQIPVEVAQRRLEERQRERQQQEQQQNTPVAATKTAAAKPKKMVRTLVLKEGAPEPVRKWFENLPALREEYVASREREARDYEQHINQVQRRPLPLVRAGGNAFGGDEMRPNEGAARARSREVQGMRQTLLNMKKQINKVRADATFIPDQELQLKVGSFGPATDVRIIQIIDEQNMLANLGGADVWISGASTANWIDGQKVDLGTTLLCTGKRSYETVLHAKRTLLKFEAINVRQWITYSTVEVPN